MAKKTNNRKLLIGIFIVIVALASIFFVVYSNSDFRPLSVSVLSVSNVQVKDSGSKILVTVTPQGTDDIEIRFTPDELNAQLEDQGYKATQSSILKVKYIESNKRFYFPYL